MNPVASFHVGQLVSCIYGVKRITAVFLFPWAPTVYTLEDCGDIGFEENKLTAV